LGGPGVSFASSTASCDTGFQYDASFRGGACVAAPSPLPPPNVTCRRTGPGTSRCALSTNLCPAGYAPGYALENDHAARRVRCISSIGVPGGPCPSGFERAPASRAQCAISEKLCPVAEAVNRCYSDALVTCPISGLAWEEDGTVLACATDIGCPRGSELTDDASTCFYRPRVAKR
jgi:hypothetical protein